MNRCTGVAAYELLINGFGKYDAIRMLDKGNKMLRTLIVVSVLVLSSAACNPKSSTYQKPSIKKGDFVLTHIPNSTEFKVGKVCAVSSTDKIENDPNHPMCVRIDEDKLHKLKENEIIVGGCFGQYGMQSAPFVGIDEVIPLSENTKSTPRVNVGETVITQGSEDANIVAHQCSPPSDLFKYWFVAVKAENSENNQLAFSFLNETDKTTHGGAFFKSPGPGEIYNTFNGWYVPSPSLAQTLKGK